MKVTSNGRDEIHFAFTDGHPRNEPLNSIYYLKYKAGKFYKADGSEIGTMSSLPVEHEDCDMVYDAYSSFEESRNGVRAWIWDVAIGDNGNPAVVYTRLPEETRHQYYYANWDGAKWSNSKISEGGSSFPRYDRPKENREPEPHYSGGIYLDHENLNVVYYSKPVNDIFEIFTAVSIDNGQTWEESSISSNSEYDNVRPFAIRGAGDEATSQLLWMLNVRYSQYTDYDTKIKMDVKKEQPHMKRND